MDALPAVKVLRAPTRPPNWKLGQKRKITLFRADKSMSRNRSLAHRRLAWWNGAVWV